MNGVLYEFMKDFASFLMFAKTFLVPTLMIIGATGPTVFFFGVSCRVIRESGRTAFAQIAPQLAVILMIYFFQLVVLADWREYFTYSLVVMICSIFFFVLFLFSLCVFIRQEKNKAEKMEN